MKSNNNLGVVLADIEDIDTCRQAHYVQIEQAIEHAGFEDIKAYYARLHKISEDEVISDPRFPFHPDYKFGDAFACCEDCVDLQMAITVNIPVSAQPLALWFPALA